MSGVKTSDETPATKAHASAGLEERVAGQGYGVRRRLGGIDRRAAIDSHLHDQQQFGHFFTHEEDAGHAIAERVLTEHLRSHGRELLATALSRPVMVVHAVCATRNKFAANPAPVSVLSRAHTLTACHVVAAL